MGQVWLITERACLDARMTAAVTAGTKRLSPYSQTGTWAANPNERSQKVVVC